MRIKRLAVLFFAGCVAVSCVRAQQRDVARKEFREQKMKAENGDAEAQFIVGDLIA